jgi:phosphoribosyl-ATP pyrophosphohydrolase/phosphoribosyl-AMP cyclohydrolase
MKYCNIIPKIYIKNGSLFLQEDCKQPEEVSAVAFCEQAENTGADEILIYEFSETDEEHEKNIHLVKEICDATDIPVLLGGSIKRLEDVKKYIYAGAKMAVLDAAKDSNLDLLKEASARFGTDKIAIRFEAVGDTISQLDDHLEDVSQEIIDACVQFANQGAGLCILEESVSTKLLDILKEIDIQILVNPAIAELNDIIAIGNHDKVYGFSNMKLFGAQEDYMTCKQQLKAAGISVNVFESPKAFSEFKLNSDGMIPVVVQDYKTNEVLMMAYMNEEAYNKTLETGRMTYYSRSRDELWVKGLTSGHYQYVKVLAIDCDSDTLLAKVKQVGAACHTGNRSCFYQTLVQKEYDDTNPLKVFEDVFNVIKDRKVNPKEGSYTNYLFDKGIDKILKKVGEEATEIIIAAKNPDKEEIKYEISDFLYHVMVLMAEKEVTWEEITKELARR